MDLTEKAATNYAREIESFGRAKEDALNKIAEHEAELAEVDQAYDQSPMDETIYTRREMLKAAIGRLHVRVADLNERIAKRQTQAAIDEEAQRLAGLARQYAELADADVADAKIIDNLWPKLTAAIVRTSERHNEMGRIAFQLGVNTAVYSYNLHSIGAVLAVGLDKVEMGQRLHYLIANAPFASIPATAEALAKRSAERLKSVMEGSR